MTDLLNVEPWWRFGAALLVGLLVGLEREFIQQRDHHRDFAGIRTFPLIGLLGAVSAFLAEEHGTAPFAIAMVALSLLIAGNYFVSVYRKKQAGMTTEVAALLVFLLGAAIIWDYADVAVALAVITALLLSLKPPLHTIARSMSLADLRATLEFAIVGAVVLPLLPNRTVDPLGVLNPFSIWLLVVFVSGISFLGYVLVKVLGTRRGIGLTALLGGLASSTAATLSFSGRSKAVPGLSPVIGWAIIISSSVMFPRVLFLVLVVNPSLMAEVLPPVAAMLVASLAVIAYLWRRQHSYERGHQEPVQVGNPLRIGTAIGFGLAFAVVLVLVAGAERLFGAAGVYIASVLAGLTDLNAITLSSANLAAGGQVAPRVAAIAIFLACMTNTLAKGVFALAYGASALRRVIVPGLGAILLAGAVSGIVWFVLLPPLARP